MLNPKINLLPYREEKKKAIKVRYITSLGIALSIGLMSLAAVHTFYSMQMTTQEARNNVLETDITSLDKQIEQIKKLRQEIAAAVARKQVVESLQANRSRAVMILNQVVQPPANIFYKSIRQVGETITLTGVAPSNTSVSALIKQFENSDIFFDPKLVESKSVVIENAPLIEFSMSAKLVNLAKVATDKNKKKALTATPTTSNPAPAQTATPQEASSSPKPVTPTVTAPPGPVPATPTPVMPPSKALADTPTKIQTPLAVPLAPAMAK